MAELKDLVAKVTVDEATTMFAAHFKTGVSVKNLLRKYGNAKALNPVVTDATIGTVALGTPEVMDAVMSAVIAGFDAYTAKKAEWDANKDKHSLPERVEFFRDAVIGELGKDEIKDTIAAALSAVNDNCDSVKALANSGIDANIIQKSILASVIRTIMISAYNATNESGSAKDVATGEKAEAEVITPDNDAAGHPTEENPKKPEDGEAKSDEEQKPQDGSSSQGDESKADETQADNKDESKNTEIEKSKVFEKFMGSIRDLLNSNADDKLEADRIREGFNCISKSIINALGSSIGITGTSTASPSTVEWVTLMLSSSLPANRKDSIGNISVDKALEFGVGVATEGIGAGNIADIDQDKISVAIMLGTFCMYSMLASQIPGSENLDWLILPILSEELMAYAAAHGEDVPVKMYKAFINLSGVTNLEKYKTLVNKTIIKTSDGGNWQFAATRALFTFANNLGAKDAQRHINRGMELYTSAVTA